jgi:hypothetical protein
MITRKSLAEQVIRLVSGFKPTQDRNIDLREVMIAVDQARDAAVVKWMYQNLQVEGQGYVAADFLNVYTDTPKYDASRKRHYLKLKYNVFSLPNDIGVYHVSLLEDEANPFIPMRNGYMSLFNGMASKSNLNNISFFVENQKIWLDGDLDSDWASTILIKMVAVSGTVPDDDEYVIPNGLASEIIRQVAQLYGVRTPADNKNDDISL